MSDMPSRRRFLCNQDLTAAPPEQLLTGIDYVRIADPKDQTVLHIFFIVDPADVPVFGSPENMVATPGDTFPASDITIASADPDYEAVQVVIDSAVWKTDVTSGRTVLVVTTESPGDFLRYAITIAHPALDWYFQRFEFSFKDACPTPFDCQTEQFCPDEKTLAVSVDYVARDFDSYRDAVLAFLKQRFPHWQDAHVPDQAVMLVEVMCALSDEFSWMQDRYAAEAHFKTATQPRSIAHLSKLVDYRPDSGSSASAQLSIAVTSGTGINFARISRPPNPGPLNFWAVSEDGEPIPFEVTIPQQPSDTVGDNHFWLHGNWNNMPAHIVDGDNACLIKGSTSLLLTPVEGTLASPLQGALDPSNPLRATPTDPPELEKKFWIGRTVILRSNPDDPAQSIRVWPVMITAVEIFRDPVASTVAGSDVMLTRIDWHRDQATPFDMQLESLMVHGNCLKVWGGRTVKTEFQVGGDTSSSTLSPPSKAVEVEAPFYDEASEQNCEPRSRRSRFGLAETLLDGLAHTSDGIPDVSLRQIAPSPEDWDYVDSLLEASGTTPAFSLERGLWTAIRSFERLGEVYTHHDYAVGDGFSISLGDGTFGRRAPNDSLFEVTYKLNPGIKANLPSGVIRFLAEPGSKTPSTLETAHPEILSCVNYMPSIGGSDPETVQKTREYAPHIFRQNPLRAVVEEDFKSILGRFEDYQQIGAGQRWTGSWLTRFVTADPLYREGLTAEQMDQLQTGGDAIRMVTRHLVVRQPIYRPLDLQIILCINTDAYAGQVKRQVLVALTGNGPDDQNALFHPDHISFGTPFVRFHIESVIQKIPGVKGVMQIRVRELTQSKYRVFSEDQITASVNEIIQVRNDRRFPLKGSVRVFADTEIELGESV